MDPIVLAREVENDYRLYLRTSFYFKDPDLRAGFERALKSEGLSKGPYLEATPVFKRGQRPGPLFESLLGRRPDEGFLSALHSERPLYSHQESAIRAIGADENIVVATGVGSGKSEAFFYPILLHLYREYMRGELGHGVRAMVLYPMNALANDQRDRLGEISRRLEETGSGFRFSFGQYTGETPEDRSDTWRRANDHLHARRPGELVLRSEMRDTPPHILLTNYSMLEYLLLRPNDSPLFDQGAAKWWTFLVLDEAHQYRGSRGAEMAMLLRRLKQRLRQGGRNGPFRCIATSATLSRGEEDRGLVASFATELFGESFGARGVIFGETEPLPPAGGESFDLADYEMLSSCLALGSAGLKSLEQLAAKIGADARSDKDSPSLLGDILLRDRRTSLLRGLVVGAARDVAGLGQEIFPELAEDRRIPALSTLVNLLMQARDASGAPLLAVRYHLFLRTLEGAFVSFLPEKHVTLERTIGSEDGRFFELALCRECGQHYFVGKRSDGKLLEAVRDISQQRFGAEFYRPVDAVELEEDEPIEPKPTKKKPDVYTLCVRCGTLTPGKGVASCRHTDTILVERAKPRGDDDEEHADKVSRCGACGFTTGGRGPVSELLYGSDGPNAVIATTIHRSLPADRRKVLAFADGRQEAAYFAWYLENSYKDVLHRHLLLTAASAAVDTGEGLSLRELSTSVRNLLRDRGVVPASMGGQDVRITANRLTFREFLTDERRISLEGTALLRWSVVKPPWMQPPAVLLNAPWSLTSAEAWDVVYELLNTLRGDRACEIRGDDPLPAWQDLGLQPQMQFRIGTPGPRAKMVRSWDGKTGKRARFLAKLLIARGVPEADASDHAVAALRHIWKDIGDADDLAPTPSDRLLLPIDDCRRLNPDWWRAYRVGGNDILHRCDTCARVYSCSIRSICPRFNCLGSLQPIHRADLPDNHYRRLYESALPGPMRVEEHTAQLGHEKAREFQREFKTGRIHVLSCSTTFELGVDLGDLDAVFLRNVPPEGFNYAQRVGRSGRRPGMPGFAVTYCRRGPHDLYHFNDPMRMLSGKVRPPTIAVHNAKIVGRHVTATALSAFLRANTERFGNVSKFFTDLAAPTGIDDVLNFLLSHRDELESALRTIVPPACSDAVGLNDGSWAAIVTGDDSRLARAEAELSSDFRTVTTLECEAGKTRDYNTANWAKRRAQTISSEDLLAFLSRKAVIPKYGFPVDVVELDTTYAARDGSAFEVSLQRDLTIGVAEFAPSSQLVANKMLWESYGLKKVAEKEWPKRYYKKCAEHQVFCQWNEGEDEPPTPCEHRLHVHEYVIPIFGFVTSRDAKPGTPADRRSRVFTTRPYFARAVGEEATTLQFPGPAALISLQRASLGVMVVLCEGRYGEGFYICTKCGAGFREPPEQHNTPFGRKCAGTLRSLSLGHEFVTDVLRLQFLPRPPASAHISSLSLGLGYALVEGAAEALEVPTTDLNATVISAAAGMGLPPIVLYDNVPGGAGIVAQLERPEILKAALAAAIEKLSKCDCGEDSSCYGCLRSYRNQFAHSLLQRGPTLKYLREVAAAW